MSRTILGRATPFASLDRNHSSYELRKIKEEIKSHEGGVSDVAEEIQRLRPLTTFTIYRDFTWEIAQEFQPALETTSGMRNAYIDEVIFHGSRYYSWRYAHRGEESAPAIILPVHDAHRRVVDLAAIDLSGRKGLWLGNVGLLGAPRFYTPCRRKSVGVDLDPRVWIKNGCRSVLVIDPDVAAPILVTRSLHVGTEADRDVLQTALKGNGDVWVNRRFA